MNNLKNTIFQTCTHLVSYPEVVGLSVEVLVEPVLLDVVVLAGALVGREEGGDVALVGLDGHHAHEPAARAVVDLLAVHEPVEEALCKIRE